MPSIGDVWMSIELQGSDLVASAKVQGGKAGEARSSGLMRRAGPSRTPHGSGKSRYTTRQA